jgi:hypothetical protein
MNDEDDELNLEQLDSLDLMFELDNGSKVHLGLLVDSLVEHIAALHLFMMDKGIDLEEFEEWRTNYEKRQLN